MRLDAETVRDVLLCLEDRIVMNDAGEVTGVTANDIVTYYNGRYSKGEILYTLARLDEAGYVIADIEYADNNISHCCVYAISFHGHEFLNLIRGDNAWKKTSSILKKLGAFSLDFVSDVAKSVLSSMITGIINQ